MEPADLAYAGIARQAELIRDGEISSVELVGVYLERIARLDPALNAFRSVLGERALLEAEQADARRAGGDGRPLLGVPVAVKDDIDVAGEPTAWGTNANERPVQHDAEVVRRLREAGAVIIGKTNVPELTIWPFTETATWGATRNPWDPQRSTGGSSGGSAAAVAAGLVGAALGSDGAGSIRIPAAWCGLFGLKPQRGRVSLAPRPRAWHGLSVNGVLTRRVADTALFHDVASGTTDVDEDRAPAPEGTFSEAASRSPGRLRIAYSSKLPPGTLSKLEADVRRSFDRTVELLRSFGHELVERDPAYGADAIPSVIVRYLRGIHDDLRTLEHPERTERRTRGMARLGGLIPKGVLQWSYNNERALAGRLNEVFADADVLMTPATAVAAAGDRSARGAGRAVDAECGRGHGPLQRRVEPHRSARRRRAGGIRGRRAAAVGAAGGTRRGRDHAAGARGAARGRARVGAGAPTPLLVSDPSELAKLAQEAARGAGELLLERVSTGAEAEVRSKSTPTDLVSEADLAAERAIRQLLRERRPQDGFVGEEGSSDPGSSGLSWVVDPLDGTINFLFGIPQWCVSVAVTDTAGTIAGAIFDPNRRELFTATRDGPALLLTDGGERVLGAAPRHLGKVELSSAMVATGLSYSAEVRAAQAKVLERVIPRVRDIRRFGSAALDLAWTALGRYDAYFERAVKQWDVAAGALVCERAGISVLDLPVHENLPWGILAAPKELAPALLELAGGP